jgi:hypothetical protein
MLCPKCGKESNNIRVCAFCQTPFPLENNARIPGRPSRAVKGAPTSQQAASRRPAGDPRNAMERRARTIRFGAIGVLAAVILVYVLFGRERDIPVDVPIPNLIGGAMSPAEATAFLATVKAAADIKERGSELIVKLSIDAYPQRREGQIAFAQRYARADSTTLGRKRTIRFLAPDGQLFAMADGAVGVVMKR